MSTRAAELRRNTRWCSMPKLGHLLVLHCGRIKASLELQSTLYIKSMHQQVRCSFFIWLFEDTMVTSTLEGLAIGEKNGNKIADFLIFSAFWVKLFLKTGLNPRELWKYGPDSAFLTAKFGFWNGFLEVRSGLSCTDTVCVVQCTDMSLACVCMAWGNALVF